MLKNFKEIRFLSVCLCAAVICGVASLASVSDIKGYSSQRQLTKASDTAGALENDRYMLSVNNQNAAVTVIDKLTGENAWCSAVDDSVYGEFSKSSSSWQAYMQSLVKITYAEISNIRDNTIDAYSADSKNTQKVKITDSGVRVDVEFTEALISLAVEISLDSDGLNVKIPFDSVKEEGEYALRSVELLPFFGASDSYQDGYIVYPDGNGALSYFGETSKKHLYTQAISLPVYSDNVLEDILDSEEPAAYLPIYGIKRNERAFLAAITEGDTSAKIKVNTDVGNAAVHLNYASFEFVYRDTYRIYLSNITSDGRNTAQTLYGSKVNTDMISGDREIKIFLLEGENADYSGMANVYRSYLLEQKQLVKSDIYSKNTLALTLLCSAKEKSGFIRRLITATTFEDAQNIIGDYRDAGVENLQVMLRGWNKNGYASDNTSFKPDSKLGGKKGLKRLVKTADELGGIELFLENDLILTSKKSNVVYTGSSVPVSNLAEDMFMRSPAKVLDLAERFEKRTAVYGTGSAYSQLGSLLYRDYRRRSKVNREEALELWNGVLSSCDEPLMVQGGNLYALKYADRLYDIPTASSQNQLADLDIPLYSMIVYGSIQITSQAGNTAYDLDECKLKWIEYGCIPYFELTELSPTELKNTSYNTLFSSENEDWFDRAVEIYREFADRLSCVSESYMTHHSVVGENIVEVIYENGVRILINYSGETAVYDGTEIPAKGYTVKEVG